MKLWALLAAVLLPAALQAESNAPAPAVWSEPLTGMPFIKVERACFQMGSAKPVAPFEDVHWERIGYKGSLSDDEVPQHEVCLDAFWIGKYEVREQDWQQIIGSDGRPGKASDLPAVRVTWDQAQTFAKRLSEVSGQRFRLPTEAEWEFACRAGAATLERPIGPAWLGRAWYSFGDARRFEVQPVGQLAANRFGVHDMLGNAWEWTQDSYLANGYARHTLHNPQVDTPAAQKVIRGGSFRTEPRQVRCANRGRLSPGESLDSVGFRLVRVE